MEERTGSKRGEMVEISLDGLELGTSQSRTDPSKGIQRLADSIAKNGLLNPITVKPTGEGKYEVVAGQRRFLAHKLLGYETIQAIVLEEGVGETEAKGISYVENVVRRDLTTAEKIDTCTALYKVYGSFKAVAEKTGLDPQDVSQFVKYVKLVPELKRMVDSAGIDMKVALQAQRAAENAQGEVDEEAAVKFAQEIKPMPSQQRKQFLKVAQEDPDATVEEKIEKGRKQPVLRQIIVTIEDGLHRRLQRYAKDEGASQDEAAASLLEEALTMHGVGDEA